MSTHALTPQPTPQPTSQATGDPVGAALPKVGYSYKEAQAITGLGRTSLWKAMKDGRLKCFKVGRRRLFSPKHLSDFMKSCEK
ncbi:MAG: helix-turn-helix domain-containing protein [Blastocatellia bacterium]|nr:helix-turn-helix domain-containing protein [Blastocatellia bacterium]